MPGFFRSRAARLALASIALAGGLAASGQHGSSQFLTGSAEAAQGESRLLNIRRLASDAYIWGLAAQFTYRFAKYNTTISSPMNALTYGRNPAAWNNAATNAGGASNIYINAFTDFSGGDELVLTVPPSRRQYYIVNYLDSFINTIGSIGTRTTPSDASTSYLLVGPKSKYAGSKTATIDGHQFPVLASDTNLNWMLIRIATSTLADGVDPRSVNSIYNGVSKNFALNTLDDFKANGYEPVFPSDYTNTPPTPKEILAAAPYKDTPSKAVRFFEQLGQALVLSPIPPAGVALGGTPVRKLPAYVVPQYGAKKVYTPPSAGQMPALSRFAPIGLTEKGFKVPANWGPRELAALQQGYEEGQQRLNDIISSQTPSEDTNYWTILNDIIGTYPNTTLGYVIRAIIVLNGGSANIPLDAVYPNITEIDGVDQLDGNEGYKITFTPPVEGASLPVIGTYPPQVTGPGGAIKGFWSVTVYQPDPSEVSAPFLPQSAVLNTAYTKADDDVTAISSTADTITVLQPSWGNIVQSTPLVFSGAGAGACGLDTLADNAIYYVASTPVTGVDIDTGKTTYTFKISTTWLQEISEAKVPIQYSGQAGPTVDLQCNSAAEVGYGVVRPVSQLGSAELEDGELVRNNDGSLTIYLAPTLPSGAPPQNWIPTPSTAYYDSLYGANSGISTALQVILRSYYPTPGNQPPSLLPNPARGLSKTYIPPVVERLGD
jgi:hypothetical protein